MESIRRQRTSSIGHRVRQRIDIEGGSDVVLEVLLAGRHDLVDSLFQAVEIVENLKRRCNLCLVLQTNAKINK